MSSHDENIETFCTEYTDFEDKNDLITDFRVQGNAPPDQLVVGNGEILDGPVDS